MSRVSLLRRALGWAGRVSVRVKALGVLMSKDGKKEKVVLRHSRKRFFKRIIKDINNCSEETATGLAGVTQSILQRRGQL